MKINFCYPQAVMYDKVHDIVVGEIIKHLSEEDYKVSKAKRKWDAECLNVLLSSYGQPANSKSIYLPHGISDKGTRTGRTMKKYGMTMVSSKAWQDKLVSQGLERSRALIGGWPKLDPLFNNPQPRPDEYEGKIVVLWAPTHTNDSKSSYHAMNDCQSWPDDIVMIKSPHPYDRRRLNMESIEPTMWDLVHADVVISDASSIIYEAWILGKPVIFPSWYCKPRTLKSAPPVSYNRNIYEQEIGLHAKSKKHIIDLVYQSQEEPLDPRAVKIAEEVLPVELRGNSGAATARELLRVRDSLIGGRNE